MPTCAAKGCRNFSGAAKMNHFPKDAARRNIWIQNSGVFPTKNSELCEVK